MHKVRLVLELCAAFVSPIWSCAPLFIYCLFGLLLFYQLTYFLHVPILQIVVSDLRPMRILYSDLPIWQQTAILLRGCKKAEEALCEHVITSCA